MAPRRTYPDDILAARLDASARRLAFDDATPSDAASELRAVAGERLDVLARVAGQMAGLWSERARWDGGVTLIAAGYLVRAVPAETADLELDRALTRWVEEGRFAARRVERDAAALAAFHHQQHRSDRTG